MTVQSTQLAGSDVFATVEIQTQYCDLTYGASPCTASLNNANACFKTRNVLNDCQDIPNFDPSPKSFFFTEEGNSTIIDGYRPLIKSISFAPSKLPPRGGLANVSKVKFTFIDEPDTDLDTDDNILDRSYIAREQGTFWGKFKARNSFLQGQIIKYTVTFLDSNGGLSTRTNIWQIESVSWANKNGEVTIIAKDPLNLTDALNAKCPPVSRVKLYSALASGSHTLAVDQVVGLKSPDQYTYFRINDEIILIDGATLAPVGDHFEVDIVSPHGRGALGTVQAAHDAGAVVQEVARFDALSINATLLKILNNYSELFPDDLDSINWAAEIASWRASNLLTNYISQPTDIKTLISEICDQNQIMIWYDAQVAKIKLKAVAPELGTLKSYNDENDIWDLQVKEDDTLRLNSCSMYFTPRSWIGGSKSSDFENIAVSIDTLYYDLYGSPKERNLYSKWITSNAVALSTTGVLINRFRASPFRITFKMSYDNFASSRLNTGDNFRLTSSQFQNPTGAAYTPEFICISTKYDKEMNLNVEAVAYSYFAGNNGPIGATSFDGQNYSTYIAANPENGGVLAWISQADGTMLNGDDSYYIT